MSEIYPSEPFVRKPILGYHAGNVIRGLHQRLLMARGYNERSWMFYCAFGRPLRCRGNIPNGNHGQ